MSSRPNMLAAVILAMIVAAGASSNANAPAGRYTVAGGTVFDTKTKLTWQQTVSGTTYTVATAKTYCATLGATLGGAGWRLPTVRELMTLVDFSKTTGPYIDTTAFLSVPTDISAFWSATVVAAKTTDNWDVFFYYGTTGSGDAGTPSAALCVR